MREKQAEIAMIHKLYNNNERKEFFSLLHITSEGLA
jgi:hypothetical protein